MLDFLLQMEGELLERKRHEESQDMELHSQQLALREVSRCPRPPYFLLLDFFPRFPSLLSLYAIVDDGSNVSLFFCTFRHSFPLGCTNMFCSNVPPTWQEKC